MAHEKQYALVEALNNKTRIGEIEWKPAFRDDVYETKFKLYSVRLSMEINFDRADDYTVVVVNSVGKTIETISAIALSDMQYNFRPNDPNYYETLRDLYELVRRKALGVEEALDDLLNELDGELPF